MDRLTDLIREHPELASLQARYEELARRYDELRQECMRMPEINQAMRAEMASLRCQLQAMPPDLMGHRRANVEAVDADRSCEADEPILVRLAKLQVDSN
jgi:hypothetical protein